MSTAERPLRSQRVKSGFALGLVSRIVRFLTSLVLARAIILKFGTETWGILALSLAVVDLVVVLDFAIHELSLYEAAAAGSREEAQRSPDQALVLSLVPAALGTVALLGCAAAAARGIGFAPDYAGPALASLFLAAAVSYPFLIVSKVYWGTIQGFGWIRELNVWVLATLVLDLLVVILGLEAGLGIVEIQWARAALAPLALVSLLFTVGKLGLPRARFSWPDRARLRPMLRYAVSYNVNRSLGVAVASINAPIAQLFVPAAHLGGFGAADQWANKLRKFTDVAWESMFHRFVRCFREGASPEEREDGRLQFLAVSLFMNLLLVPAGVILILVSPWLFRHWLDAEKAVLPLALLPGLVAAWTLNAACSPLTWVVMAANRFAASARIHVAVVIVNLALTVALTRARGIAGTVEAMAISNALLAALLSVAACRISGASWWRFLRSNSVPYAVALIVLFARERFQTPWAPWAAGALSLGASLAVATQARSFRSMREILGSAR